MEPTGDLNIDLRIWGSSWEGGPLRPFFASFGEWDGDAEDKEVGGITGWVVWSAEDSDVAFFGDGLSADSSVVSAVGEELVDGQEWDEDYVEHLILIDRVWLAKEHRGKGRLGEMLDFLVQTLRMDEMGCFVVAELEPQKEGGGPYPYGPERDRALAGLRRSFESAGFAPHSGGRAWWRKVAPRV